MYKEDVKEYSFNILKRKYISDLATMFCIYLFFIVDPFFSVINKWVLIYNISITSIFLIIASEKLYIILLKKYNIPNLVISNRRILLKGFWFKLYSIEINNIESISEISLTTESLMLIKLKNKKKIRFSLNRYIKDDRVLIHNLLLGNSIDNWNYSELNIYLQNDKVF